MPNLTSKKTKTVNSTSLIKNQITNILQPVNGTIAITQPTNTILTQNAVSQNYYIPLLEKITGEQSITARVPLSFNATTNTLSVPNLTTSNLPTCNVDASNSSDLVRKSYANTYCYFDLSGGDRWYCEDWITGSIKGKYNWVYTRNMSVSENFGLAVATNVFPNHIGILTLGSSRQNYQIIYLPVKYHTSKLKSIRFIFSHEPLGGQFYIGIFENINDPSSSSSSKIGFTANDSIFKGVYNTTSNTTTSTTLTAATWYLVEIYKSSNNIKFSFGGNSFNGTLNNDFDGNIGIYVYSNTAAARRVLYIDYIDWVVSS
jgi:hypothetical protein